MAAVGPTPRPEPHWVKPFLAALAVCGQVARSAGLAGVDVSGPYNRRARDAAFKAEWDRVVAAREERAAVVGGTCPLSPLACRESPSPAGGEGQEAESEVALVGIGALGVRLGRGARSRWSPAVEDRFLGELTASANVARAAAAVGFSATAVYTRKARDKHFAAGWEAAIAVGRSRLEAFLLTQADRVFDPEGLPIAEGAVKVSVGDAIAILKLRPAGERGAGARTGPRSDGYMDYMSDDDLAMMEQAEAARERILERLDRMAKRIDGEKEALGWTLEGEDWIPPGWGKA